MNLRVLISLVCGFSVLQAFSIRTQVERLEKFGHNIPQEKVFVHMDNTCYFMGDTIWYAAYLRNTSTGKPSELSRILYVELLDNDGYLVERQKVWMDKGHGKGNFVLNKPILYSGYYELRAYTRWQLNWGVCEHPHSRAAEEWFVSKEMEKRYYRDYEKLYSRVFPVYDRPEDSSYSERKMTLRPLRRYFRKPQDKREMSLSFFPEGGNLVAGVPCRVAFEATMDDGEYLEGKLYVAGDSAATIHRGRGVFTLTPRTDMERSVEFRTNDGRQVKAELPEVQESGVSVRVGQTDGSWKVNVHTNGLPSDSLGLTLMHQGVLRFFTPIDRTHSEIQIPDSSLTSGVQQITVFNNRGDILADRLFFVSKKEMQDARATIRLEKDEYNPYEPIRLKVSMPKSAKQACHVSISVRDALQGDLINDNGNILTEMLLCSEIRGFVPNPGWYFEQDDDAHRMALDLLMMVQGWRRFNWHSMAVPGAWEFSQPVEQHQIIKGSVSTTDRNTTLQKLHGRHASKKKSQEEVVAFARLQDHLMKEEPTDATVVTKNREFALRLEHYSGNALLFVGATSLPDAKKKKDYDVRIDFPYPRFVKPYSYYRTRNVEAPFREGSYLIERSDTLSRMQEITVGAKRNGLKNFSDQYPVMVIDDWDVHNLIMDTGIWFTDTPLARALFGDLGQVWPFISRWKDGKYISQSKVQTRVGHNTLDRLLDDKEIAPSDSVFTPKHLKSTFAMEADLTEEEMSGYIEKYVIYTDYAPRKEGSKNYQATNLPEVVIVQYPYQDGSVRQRFSTRFYMMPGIAEPADFYHVDYSKFKLPEGTKDHRRTLYWHPDVTLDENGEATISLYNNSGTTHIAVEMNGQTEDGTLLWGRTE